LKWPIFKRKKGFANLSLGLIYHSKALPQSPSRDTVHYIQKIEGNEKEVEEEGNLVHKIRPNEKKEEDEFENNWKDSIISWVNSEASRMSWVDSEASRISRKYIQDTRWLARRKEQN
jgi:hypothetical protein